MPYFSSSHYLPPPPPTGVVGLSLARICQMLSAPFAVSFFSRTPRCSLISAARNGQDAGRSSLTASTFSTVLSRCVSSLVLLRPPHTQARTHTTSASCSFLSFLIPLHHWELMTGLIFLEPQFFCFSTTPSLLVCRCPQLGIYKGSVRNKTG